ncbi:acyltransferase family protein [Demequina soli]|uniref:acyltransferase family protein n=1 Tax=Demequina soli TaxID=1638987 RepID=UPI00078368C1|nr:acyltransferase family protein [Demequina soli]
MQSTVPANAPVLDPAPPASSPAAAPDGFRADIQALRALAVTLVVVYHLWPARLSGGYVGVDVFFVISGYLITSHLWREAVATGRIRLGRFWARRARRLLPSALTVLAATAAATLAFAPEALAPGFLKETVAATLYGENWYLASQAVDYLGAESAASPVRHYWSLSVEEQFYVLLPVAIVAALWAARRLGLPRGRVVAGVVLTLGAASLAYGIQLTGLSPAAYFSTFTRLWEFAAGAAVALLVRAPRPRGRLALAGVALVLWSAVAFDGTTPFPGYHAAVPVVGTALALHAGAGTFLARVGGWRPVAHVGRTSYAIYLWHWPLIVLVPLALGTDLTGGLAVAILAATLGLAALSTALIEDPVRFSPRLLAGRPPRIVAAWSAAGMAVVVAIAGAGLMSGALEARHERAQAAAVAARLDTCAGAGALVDPSCADAPPSAAFIPAVADLATDDENRPDCWSGLGDPEMHRCVIGPAEGYSKRFLVLGDSHSSALISAYDLLGESTDWRFDVSGHAGCYVTDRPLGAEGTSFRAACDAWRGEALAALDGADAYDAVIVTRRQRHDLTPAEQAEEADGLVRAWSRVPAGTPVLVIPDNPRLPDAFVACLEAHGPAGAAACGSPRAEVLPPDQLRDAARRTPDARIVDLTDLYCDDVTCPAVIGGVTVYRADGQHLTASYARTLAPMLRERIGAALAG